MGPLLLFQTRWEAQALALKSWQKAMMTACFIALMELGWEPCLCLPLPLTKPGSRPQLLALPPWSLLIFLLWNALRKRSFLKSLLQGRVFKCEEFPLPPRHSLSQEQTGVMRQ